VVDDRRRRRLDPRVRRSRPGCAHHQRRSGLRTGQGLRLPGLSGPVDRRVRRRGRPQHPREIRVWVDEGRSDDFIRDQLVANFGEDIDYTPPSDGITALVWILPVVAGSVAGGGLVLAFRKWRLESDLEATNEDTALVEAARAR
jgi:hypothetical protein